MNDSTDTSAKPETPEKSEAAAMGAQSAQSAGAAEPAPAAEPAGVAAAAAETAEAAEATEEADGSDEHSSKNWYAVQVLVGFEKAIKENLLDRIHDHGMEEHFGEILLPIERVMEIQNGKKKMNEKKLYPGYLFLQIAVEWDEEMGQDRIRPECWHLVRRTRRVGDFISGSLTVRKDEEKIPAPLARDVVEKIRRQMRDSFEKTPVMRAQFVTGDQVRIKEGPFSDFSGTVDAVNAERRRLTVMVMVFGRSTPVELDFTQVDKV